MAMHENVRRPVVQSAIKSAIVGSIVSLSAIWVFAPAIAQTTQPATQAAEELDLRSAYSGPPETWPAAHWDESIAPEDRHELGLVSPVEHPENNPFSREKAELGRMLFWDGRLSTSRGVACVSCHHPDLGWADGRTTSLGHQLQQTDRNAPSLIVSAYMKELMWDGRAKSLEEQALLPLANPKEMHAEFTELVSRVNEQPGYREQFKKIFGVEQASISEIAKALATFQRTIVPGRSRFDTFLKGNKNVLSDSELRGLHLFRTIARCINCHSGPLMTDQKYHNLGISFYGRAREDRGRWHITNKPEDMGAFRTPTMRNVTRTGPYMHNGLFDLDGAINLYNAGGSRPARRADQVDDPLFPTTSALLKPLGLTRAQRADLIDFLHALEEPRLRIRSPRLPGIDASTQPVDEQDEAN